MKVKELMERIGVKNTGRVLAYLKDGLEELNVISETHVNTERIDITEDQRFYDLPDDTVKVLQIRCKNQLNGKDEYRQIPRLVHEPVVVDADGT